MKKIVNLILSMLISNIVYAQQQAGINFQKNKSWKETLELAKAENKLVFVDVYTDWCGPCKVMDAEVFPKKAVGDAFNTSFINYKLDAEKGEGPEISKKYLVKSYPNYLFINGDGVLIYRATSSMPASEFLNVAKNALTESQQEQTVVELDQLYPVHKKDKAFMYNYLTRRTTLRLDNIELIDEYINLLTEDERGETKNLQLILDNGMFLAKSLQLGISLETLKKNKDKFSQLKQKYKEGIDGIENTAVSTTLKLAIAKKDEKLLDQVLLYKKPAGKAYFDNKESTYLSYYLGTHQTEKYLRSAKEYVENSLLKISLDTLAKHDEQLVKQQRIYLQKDTAFKENLEEALADYKHAITIQLTNAINNIAKNFGTIKAPKSDLKKAINWLDYAFQITAKDPTYYQNVSPFYMETYAILNYKAGNRKLAITKLEKMVQEANNPRITSYFTPIVTKMKAKEEL